MQARYWAPAVVAVEFNPVRTVSDLIAHDAREAVYAIGFLGSLRYMPLGRETLRSVTASGHDSTCGGEHARARHDALIYCLLQFDISVASPLGAEVAYGREAGEQSSTQMIDCTGGTQRESFMRHLVSPGSFIVRMQQDVRVPFNETRQQREAGQRNPISTDIVNGRRRTDCIDPVSPDTYDPTFVQLVAIEYTRGPEHYKSLRKSGKCHENSRRKERAS